MSELRIALVAEGPTDYELIKAALKAFLPQSFVLTLLQPEDTSTLTGTGWSGVLKWCHAVGQRHNGPLDSDPLLFNFDILVIHLDADVARSHYGRCGPRVEELAVRSGWHKLPCALPCPPVADTCSELGLVLASWLGQAKPGSKTVWCIPAQSTGAWLAAAILPGDHRMLVNAECNSDLELQLENLPKQQRIRKTPSNYRQHSSLITDHWSKLTQLFSQAKAFEEAVTAIGLVPLE